MQRLKTRILNPYTILVVILGLSVLIFSYLMDGVFWQDLHFDVNAPDLPPGMGEEIRRHCFAHDLNMDYFIHEGMQLYLFICGILPSLAVLRFFDEKETILKNTYLRTGHYKREMIRTFSIYSVIAGAATALPYYLFYILNLIVGNQSFENSMENNGQELSIHLFDDILGFPVFKDNMALFFGLFGIMLFLFGVAYGFLALCSTLVLDRKYQVLLVNFAMVVIPGLIFINFNLSQFSPFYTLMGFSGEYGGSTWGYLVPLILPIALGIFMLIFHRKQRAGFER